MHHQCIFNASIMHHKRFVNALSMHSSTHHQGIVSEFVNAFISIPSMHLSIYHQCIIIASNASISFIQFFLSFIKFIQVSSFALLFVHSLLCCCHSFLLSSFLFKFTLLVQFIFQAFTSFAVRSGIQSSTIILFLCLANS